MIWPFKRKDTTETGAEYYIRDAAMADAKAIVMFKHRIWRQIFAELKDETFLLQKPPSMSKLTFGNPVLIGVTQCG